MKTKAQGRRATKTPRPEPRAPDLFPAPDRFTQCGKRVGDICFECECRILEIRGADGDGIFLAWCECAWPEEHHEMEIHA